MSYQAKTKDKKSEAIQYGPKTPARISLRRSKFWKPEKKADGTDKNAKFYGYATDKDGTLYKLSMWDNEENSVPNTDQPFFFKKLINCPFPQPTSSKVALFLLNKLRQYNALR